MAGAFGSMETRILSRPFPVEWAGWETTTQRLYSCGWQIASQYEFGSDQYRFMFKHEQMDLMGYADWMYISKSVASVASVYDRHNLPTIQVGYVARHFQMARLPAITNIDYMTDWQLVDGRTQLCETPVRTMEDFSVFAKLHPKEILIPQADMSVVEQLEAIIKAQEPRQHELRQIILAKPRGIRQIASIAEVA